MAVARGRQPCRKDTVLELEAKYILLLFGMGGLAA
jgi:hypothetical protein